MRIELRGEIDPTKAPLGAFLFARLLFSHVNGSLELIHSAANPRAIPTASHRPEWALDIWFGQSVD